MHIKPRHASWLIFAVACSGNVEVGDDGSPSTSESSDGGESDTADTNVSTESDDATSTEGESDDGPKFDVEGGDDVDPGPGPSCKVEDDMDAVPPCVDQAPPDSFEPEVQWEWSVPPEDADGKDSVVTPLVANLTDDNDDGEIDLCDTPDIVVVAGDVYGGDWFGMRLYILDGETGEVHAKSEPNVTLDNTPAIGDIDGDGEPEIVMHSGGAFGGTTMYEPDLTPVWTAQGARGTLAIADLDNDGDAEIIASGFNSRSVIDHTGEVLWSDVFTATHGPAVAVDLDGDDDLEIVLGQKAYHHDGSIYYENPDLGPGHAQVADLDDDGLPEILLINKLGVALLEHDGAITYQDANPTNVDVNVGGYGPWLRPAAIHDFDGDGSAEFAVSSLDKYGVFEADATPIWLSDVLDQSGRASGTAFDFLGDGGAEAIYGDETKLYVFDDTGQVLLAVDRVSPTQIEYPVVADVDNDQSAEIVVVSSEYPDHPNLEPTTVKVIRDAQDRWIPARRIWNQHTYHVTNVREDGTIPQFEPKHWEGLNTFRTQAQLSPGGICKPEG